MEIEIEIGTLIFGFPLDHSELRLEALRVEWGGRAGEMCCKSIDRLELAARRCSLASSAASG